MVSAWAAVDGASVTAAEVRQYLKDEQVTAGLETAGTVVGAGVALTPLTPMASIGVDAAVELIQRQAVELLTGGPLPEGAGQSLISDRVGSLEEFVRASVEEYQRVGVWDRAGVQAGDTSAQIANDFAHLETGRYEDIVGAMRARSSDRMEDA